MTTLLTTPGYKHGKNRVKKVTGAGSIKASKPLSLLAVSVWRRMRDSNPRDREVKWFSRPPRYDRFANPPSM